ncbi:MAG: ABC transporter substrate-binding protein [Bacteroidales bacterium]|nr:ABC transporter substrate-binding protein [Bacteroidales bacterium]
MYRFIKFFLLAIIIFSFSSCNKNSKDKNNSNQDYILKLKDTYGQEIKLKTLPKRIISLSPAITELVFELESGYKLIGRTDFCNYPKDSVKNIPTVGGINNASIEMIISLKPDLVITSSVFTKSMSQTIQNAGIQIISLPEKPEIQGLYETLNTLGKILDKEEKSKEIIDNFKASLNNITSSRINKSIKPKVYYVIQYGVGGDFSAGENTFINEIIELSGGENIAKKTKNWSFSKEEIFANQPDYIFLRKEDSAQFVKTHPYNTLNAVKNKRVYGIESSWMDIQSSRTLKAIEYISNIINK